MLELSWNGSEKIELGTSGITRTFLEDGDTVIMEAGGYLKNGQFLGFGPLKVQVLSPL